MCDNQGCKIGFDYVLRDDNGVFVAAISISWFGTYSLREVETIVVREALISWIKGLNMNFVQVELDSLLVIQDLNIECMECSFDIILDDIRSNYYKQFFSNVYFFC